MILSPWLMFVVSPGKSGGFFSQQPGAFSEGYSGEFAQLMRECCQSLMVKFSAICRLARF